MDTDIDEPNNNGSTLHDLVAQGACYPMAMIVWHQLRPRPMVKKTARRIAARLNSSPALENHSSEDACAEAAMN